MALAFARKSHCFGEKNSYFLRMNDLCILSKYSLWAFFFAKARVHKRAVAAFRTRNPLS